MNQRCKLQWRLSPPAISSREGASHHLTKITTGCGTCPIKDDTGMLRKLIHSWMAERWRRACRCLIGVLWGACPPNHSIKTALARRFIFTCHHRMKSQSTRLIDGNQKAAAHDCRPIDRPFSLITVLHTTSH